MSNEQYTLGDRLLLPEHRRILEECAIPIDFAIRHRVRSIDLVETKRKRGEYGIKPLWPHLPLHPVTGLLVEYNGQWSARALNATNARVFAGEGGEALVFDGAGNMFRGNLSDRAAFAFREGGQIEVIFNALKGL